MIYGLLIIKLSLLLFVLIYYPVCCLYLLYESVLLLRNVLLFLLFNDWLGSRVPFGSAETQKIVNRVDSTSWFSGYDFPFSNL
jgi:hypothetical protein